MIEGATDHLVPPTIVLYSAYVISNYGVPQKKTKPWTFRGILRVFEYLRESRPVLFPYTVVAEDKVCFLYIAFLCSCDNYFHQAHTLFLFCTALMCRVLTSLKDRIFIHSVVWFLNCKLWSSSRGSQRVCLILQNNSKQNPLKHSCFERVAAAKMKRNLVLMCHHNQKQTKGCLIQHFGAQCEMLPI